MKRFDGCCLFSDMDGTLVDADFKLPRRNIEAIRYFTDNGGRFAVATGRGLHPMTLELLAQLSINLPCVMLNGGLIYDVQSKKALHSHHLPFEKSKKLAALLTERYPEQSIVVWCDSFQAQLGINKLNMLTFEERSLDSITEPVLKMVVSNDEGKQQETVQFLKENISERIYTTTSSPRFTELMPRGISKAQGIESLIAELGLCREKVIVMGDYFNDIEMLSLTGVRSFCPENAHEDIKRICERSFCHVDDGAVADAIEFLDKELGE